MADPVTKPKRRKATKDPPAPVPLKIAVVEQGSSEFAVVSPPALRSVDQQRQRKKLKVMQELEDFRASFSRGYAVIVAELAKKHKQQGSAPKVPDAGYSEQ